MSRNRLAEETSPYLLQHKDNPVHWWPWGPEALAEARRTGKPMLLSVGYSACHWCHVMAHESFEDEPTAALMNDLFINIKVDREERPDIDAIYMNALHRLGEQGGWPLTMFLDADGRPFFGGTYFPPASRYGRPGFSDVLKAIARIYREEPEKAEHNSRAILADLERRPEGRGGIVVGDRLLADMTTRLTRATDPVHGGIVGAPKFPQWSFFWLLWRGAIRYGNADAARAVTTTLTGLCQGGIYDHLGGGFARYSTDERWLAPHFEKMLYDNALLVDLLTDVWRETHDPLYRIRVEETVAWLAREMTTAGGAFAASLDADSEGEEGRFYVWTLDEIIDVLGPSDATRFAEVYDVAEGGNWEGHVILNRLKDRSLRSHEDEAALRDIRDRLLSRRDQRVRPGFDDKVLTDWNGLMIAALARAATVFERPDWLAMAVAAYRFVKATLLVDGRFRHSWRVGRLNPAAGTSSDYANMIWAAIRLDEATADRTYLADAVAWTDTLHRHYWLTDFGRYATTADDTVDVIVRLADGLDNATPSANSIQITNLAHLALLTGSDRYVEQAATILESLSPDIGANPASHTGVLAASLDILAPQQVVIIAGDGEPEMRATLHGLALPGALEHCLADPSIDLGPGVDGKTTRDGKATLYACLGRACQAPVTDPAAARELLQRQRAPVG
ncbi:MAG: thioredoxin domain-containing protein [Hyphomicrobiaceae bacterium]|nr:thioredoxin domain-containing protein [Hyphomicrobiaceae bacterium]